MSGLDNAQTERRRTVYERYVLKIIEFLLYAAIQNQTAALQRPLTETELADLKSDQYRLVNNCKYEVKQWQLSRVPPLEAAGRLYRLKKKPEYWVIANVNLHDEIVYLLQYPCLRTVKMPQISIVRKETTHHAEFALAGDGRIDFSPPPNFDAFYVKETIAHELAHLAVGARHDHDKVWAHKFESIAKQGYGVRVHIPYNRVDYNCLGLVAGVLRGCRGPYD